MPNIAGGCLCGGVRYEGEAEPVLLVVLPKGVLRTEGLELSAFEHLGGSGQPVVRRFCPRCGSPVLADVAVTPEWDWLMAGTLDDTSWVRPQMNIWCASAQPWVSTDDDIPACEGPPPLGG